MTLGINKAAAVQTVEAINMRPAFVDERSAGSMGSNLQLLAKAENTLTEESWAEMVNGVCMTYGVSNSAGGAKQYGFASGTAFIPVHGSLINRFGGAYGYVTGYSYIRRAHAMALNDPDVERIVFDINSGGGEAAGCMELSEEIFNRRGEKPTLAVVNSNCYSAAYAIGSAADTISITPSGGAGSIGALIIHADMSKMLADVGIEISVIRAGDRKAEGNPFEKLSEQARAELQSSVDSSRKTFVATVARNRGISEKLVFDTEAKTYSANDAKDLGLVDRVETPEMALHNFIYGKESGTEMTTKNNTEAPTINAAEEQSKGAKAEQARIKGILNCEEAKGRESLANHIAFNTSMSEEEAKGMLLATPVAEAKAEEVKPEANNFVKAMNEGTQPGIVSEPVDTDQPVNQNADNELLNDLSGMGYFGK
ncbi:head maturation protease [Providencia phage Kokobel1]|uniref:Head-tail preconnector protease C / scaffolding domain Nu3 protein n=1 Tax=Providencia phage Kokobel1 TaxID=2783540 RepID=A0A873WLW9_9CAUD|nr:head maturation protease [Providencia phage Kokobel1]QPB11459.1 head-tail preconnector protease C / scaffolding domain Nu3 protein [Providencia phage Kokobel1]